MTSDPTAELSKLTVPQLKALCKERRITGYSKLGKAALLERLGAHAPSNQPAATSLETAAPSASDGVTTQGAAATPSDRTGSDSLGNSSIDTSHVQGTYVEPNLSSVNLSTTSIYAPSSDPGSNDISHHSRAPSHPTDASTTTLSKEALGNKRSSAPMEPAAEPPPKKTKINQASRTSDANSCDIGSRTLSTLSAFKVPAVPKVNLAATASLTMASPAQDCRARPASLTVSTFGTQTLASKSGKRFRPLAVIVSASKFSSEPTSAISRSTSAIEGRTPSRESSRTKSENVSLYHLDFPDPEAPVPLQPISLPPPLSRRRLVYRWSVILSGLSGQQRTQCVLVSKLFRYAVYSSAGHRLVRDFTGRRLENVREAHPSATTNFWPCLCQREHETRERKERYYASFLGSFYRGLTPISERLWSSPDDHQQLTIILRFLTTRLWFAISISGSKQNRFAWLLDIVTGAQPVVKGEIWRITVQSPRFSTDRITPLRTKSFYVLQSTCEVIGQPAEPIDPGSPPVDSIPVRPDWMRYIEHRVSSAGVHSPGSSLFSDHLKWAHTAEYKEGISIHWLKRMADKGEEGVALRIVAERYVLACVVGNSVSGSWKSATQMAQDFAGLSERAPNPKQKEHRMSMFLPAHHHVESVHFTAAGGKPLHPALAVVQTPGREYFILKDNGMQVGCEEDGIAEIWTRIIGCDARGVLVGPPTMSLVGLDY